MKGLLSSHRAMASEKGGDSWGEVGQNGAEELAGNEEKGDSSLKALQDKD